jgi:aspartyl-tRNA(Asn)/glutamyl-tRNA(Gln) amidotransferase subunit B
MWKTQKTAKAIISEQGLSQISDESAVAVIVDQVLAANPGQVSDYRGGKTKLFGFFVGQIMKVSKGQANPEVVNKLLKQKLEGE